MNIGSLFKDILDEATLSRTIDTLKKAEWSKKDTDALYASLFDVEGFETDRRKYRVFLPFSFSREDNDEKEVEKGTNDFLFFKGGFLGDYFENIADHTETSQKNIKKFFNTLARETSMFSDASPYADKVNYREGYFFDQEGKPVRFKKAFDKMSKGNLKLQKTLSDIYKLFLEDRLRDGATKIDFNNMQIVISKNPLDIINQSTDRSWTSCMNLETGLNKEYVKEDLKHGALIAYLINSNDKTVSKPLARVLIKPYTGEKKGGVLLKTSVNCYNVLYGHLKNDLMKKFKEAVEAFVEKNWNSKNAKARDFYKRNDSLYLDQGDKIEISKTGFSKVEEIKDILDNKYYIVENKKTGLYNIVDLELKKISDIYFKNIIVVDKHVGLLKILKSSSSIDLACVKDSKINVLFQGKRHIKVEKTTDYGYMASNEDEEVSIIHINTLASTIGVEKLEGFSYAPDGFSERFFGFFVFEAFKNGKAGLLKFTKDGKLSEVYPFKYQNFSINKALDEHYIFTIYHDNSVKESIAFFNRDRGTFVEIIKPEFDELRALWGHPIIICKKNDLYGCFSLEETSVKKIVDISFENKYTSGSQVVFHKKENFPRSVVDVRGNVRVAENHDELSSILTRR